MKDVVSNGGVGRNYNLETAKGKLTRKGSVLEYRNEDSLPEDKLLVDGQATARIGIDWSWKPESFKVGARIGREFLGEIKSRAYNRNDRVVADFAIKASASQAPETDRFDVLEKGLQVIAQGVQSDVSPPIAKVALLAVNNLGLSGLSAEAVKVGRKALKTVGSHSRNKSAIAVADTARQMVSLAERDSTKTMINQVALSTLASGVAGPVGQALGAFGAELIANRNIEGRDFHNVVKRIFNNVQKKSNNKGEKMTAAKAYKLLDSLGPDNRNTEQYYIAESYFNRLKNQSYG